MKKEYITFLRIKKEKKEVKIEIKINDMHFVEKYKIIMIGYKSY